MTTIQAWTYSFENQEVFQLVIPENIANLDAVAITLPEGVYTTLRIYKYNKFFQLGAHFLRLEESMRLSEVDFKIEKYSFGIALNQLVNQYNFENIKLRLHIPFNNPKICNILLEKIIPYPMSVYRTGIKVKTNQLLRNNPRAKLTSFIQKAYEEKQSLKNLNLEESIITNDNFELLEGLTSNFYAVRQNMIFTADKNVLHGITRKLILEESEKNGVQVIFSPIQLEDLSKISEAFITSTNRGVMPVIQIDDIKIGNGLPGKITKNLAEYLKDRINKELEVI